MKTICIYHSRDLDGWVSAAIVKKAIKHDVLIDLNTGEEGGKMIANPDTLYMLGWDYGDPIPDLSEYDKVIMCDVSFSFENMVELISNKNFIWIDHHISAIKELVKYENENIIDNQPIIEGLQDDQFAACELTWEYFFPNEEMPEIVRLLGRYDCFGHKGTDEEQKVLEFQYAAREEISNYDDAYDALCADIDHDLTQDWIKSGRIIYNYLCAEAEQTYKKAFPIELMEPAVGNVQYGATTRKFLCVNQERFNPINFGIDYHKDGYDGFACFWYKDGKWSFSLYNDNGKVDCSAIAKQYGGGGHLGAAGFVVDNLDEIIK